MEKPLGRSCGAGLRPQGHPALRCVVLQHPRVAAGRGGTPKPPSAPGTRTGDPPPGFGVLGGLRVLGRTRRGLELGDPLLCAQRRAPRSPAEGLVTLLLGEGLGGVLGQLLGEGSRGAPSSKPAVWLCDTGCKAGLTSQIVPNLKGSPLKPRIHLGLRPLGAWGRRSQEQSTRCRAGVLPPNSSGLGGDCRILWARRGPCGRDLVSGGGGLRLPLATRGLSAAGGEGAVPLGAGRG